MHLYPSEFMALVKRAWQETRLYEQEEQVPQLPDDISLRRMLDVAYHASLLTEEHRRPHFRVVFCPRSEFDPAPGPRLRSCVKIDFHEPVPFNEKQLLQLSPATDPTSVLIAIEPDGKGALQIWGLLDTGSSWWAHQRRESERTIHSPPDYLTITSNRPGRLLVTRAWRVLLWLENGQLLSPAGDLFLGGPVAMAFADPIDKLHERVYGDLVTDDPFEPALSRHNCAVKYVTTLKRLLTYMCDKRHGGILMVVPDDADARHDIDSIVQIRYACRHYELWSKLRGVLEHKRRWFELASKIASGGETCSKQDVVDLTRLRSDVEEHEHDLTDGLQVMAALSAVDGAVVMSDRLRLLGFGAELLARSTVNIVHKATDNEAQDREPVKTDSFGTRHRSSFRFCAEYPAATAFVHSQDGGLRVVKRVGENVVYWPVNPPVE